jgi:hypothetical protein
MGEAPSASIPRAEVLAHCAYCRRPLEADDITLTVYRDGAPVASYHEHCRPDRRRSGCSGAAC